MNGGSPPTAPNARAGLFTPPGMTRQACAERLVAAGQGEFGLRDVAGVVGFIVGRVDSERGNSSADDADDTDGESRYPEVELSIAVTSPWRED